MKLLKVVLVVLLAVIIIMFSFLAYSGIFTDVEVKRGEKGPYYLVYKPFVGSYEKIAPTMESLHTDLKEQFNYEGNSGFGIYFDKPGSRPNDELRSIVGAVVTKEQFETIGDKLKSFKLEKGDAVYATFPFKNQISIIIGIFKVYPELDKYIKDNGLEGAPIMEMYDMENKVIEYIAPLSADREKLISLVE